MPYLGPLGMGMTPERMKQYGKGLGLWQDKRRAVGDPITHIRDDNPRVELVDPGSWTLVEPAKDDQTAINPIANGVFIWTEIVGAGHAFVSVHQENNPYVYTYGRFGRTGEPYGAVGDGVLNFFRFGDARTYYQSELYGVGARVFRIDDADPAIARAHFERLWNSGRPVAQTPTMGDMTRRAGRTIDQYDVTGVNCTTHVAAAIKVAGSSVFKGGYSTNAGMWIEQEEDFAVPLSLQRFLLEKSAEPSMIVVDMTGEFMRQYPNTEGVTAADESERGTMTQRAMAEAASAVGTVSPYSGGSIGGLLDGAFDVSK